MANPQVGTSVEIRVPNNSRAPGLVRANVVLGTPNKADIAWFADSGTVERSKGVTQDDTLSADNTFRIVAGGV